ncbi:hypothetical protein [Arthrobacter ramosus]|uniref:Uncharacterized protein n=1 Tax=Arthrobacter ramosus TaxID=1672 RepID=A0ABV5XXG1_ARTRM|nr:hypothetical protein [Arthrobacter ramosus]
MKRAAKAGIVVAGVVAVGLAGAITLNATQTSSNPVAGAAPSATVSAAASAASAPGATKTPAATPSATASAQAASASASAASASAAPSNQAPVPAPASTAKPDAPVPAPAAPAPAPAAPPGAQGLDAAGIQRIKDSCTARLQSDAAHSSIVTGTVVPRPFTVVSIAFSGNPVQSTAASYDILMKITTKLVDGPAQDSVRVCRVYDSDSHVDWLPAG